MRKTPQANKDGDGSHAAAAKAGWPHQRQQRPREDPDRPQREQSPADTLILDFLHPELCENNILLF